MRKLATVQSIKAIEPIDNADQIETARVLGWQVVVRKNMFQPGMKAVYFETDTLLPETNPHFASFQSHGQKSVVVNGTKVKGHVLRTRKLRGVVSQGLLMSLAELGLDSSLTVGTDVTDMIGVHKWEEQLPQNGNIIGRFDTKWAPKTDAIRVQTLAEYWDLIKSMKWVPTVKVDGSSQTLLNDGENIRIFSRNWETSKDVAGFQVAEQFGLVDAIKQYPGMAVQFELAGPKFNGNRLKLEHLRPFVFAIWENSVKVPHADWDDVFNKFSVPVLGDEWAPTGDLDEMIEKVSTLRGQITNGLLDEGIVFHLVDDSTGALPEWLDVNRNFKIINNKYLLKHGL